MTTGADAATAGAGAPAASGPAAPRRRLEPTAIGGVMYREVTVFLRFNWASTTFSSVVEPTIYLLAFGFGFGALVTQVGGLDYIEFIGTGIVAVAVLFASAFPAMFGTFVKRRYQRTYDAVLAAPVDVGELVTAEAAWLAIRAGIYGMAPLLVATIFGLRPGAGVVLVPLIGLLTGFGFAAFGILLSALMPTIDSFSYIISAVLTPLFLLAGTFFPIDALPAWASVLALANPLYHCVQLVRGAVFGFAGLAALGHVAALLAFGAVTWTLAVARLRRRLID